MDEDDIENENSLRSIRSVVRSPVLFENKTEEKIELFWLNFSGEKVSYGNLGAADKSKIDSFVTHPWIAVDSESQQRLWLNSKDVFYPPVPKTVRVVIARNDRVSIKHVVKRENILITCPVYNAETLMDLCCCVLSNTMKLEDVEQLHLPNIIKREIRKQYKNS